MSDSLSKSISRACMTTKIQHLESQLALAREGLKKIIKNGEEGEWFTVFAKQTLAALDGKAGEGR